MFLEGDGANGMKGTFPKVPLAYEESGDRSMRILQEADYIARTKARGHFPGAISSLRKTTGSSSRIR